MSDAIKAFGLEIPAPYEGFMATEAIVVLKGIDSDGDMALTVRHTPGLESWDLIGMLTTGLDMAKASSASAYQSSDDLDDEDDE